MTPFLYSAGRTYSYDDLLAALHGESYFPVYRTEDLFSLFANMLKALVAGRPLVLIDSDASLDQEGIEGYEVNREEPIPQLQCISMQEVLEAVRNSSSSITIFTSGTTGQPKKVVHTMTTLTRNVRTGSHYSGQVWAFAYNPTHMAGLQVFFQVLFNLGTLINVFGQGRSEVYHAIAQYHITHISATPTFYRLLLPFEQEFPNVQRITFGGEKSGQQLHDAMHRIFPNAKINNIYASTEAGTLFSAQGDAFLVPKSIRDKVQVIDGELLIHRSLLGSSDSFSFDGDYYHTGDLVEWVDPAAGLFRFRSRKNELVNVGGYKVNPFEVEEALLAIPGVNQAHVYGKANSVLGNVLCADVQAEEGSGLTETALKQYLSANLQDFKVPRRIKFVDAIELTRTGKMKRI